MPLLFPYHIFISHAWRYGDEYERLVNMLNSAPNFKYLNYSAPEDKPLQNLNSTDVHTSSQIRAAIKRKIEPSSVVLVISGMYYNYSRWMQYELDTAIEMKKPIIGIRPWGQQRTPVEVLLASDEMVSWNTASIVSAIRRFVP